jgi:hypothetical protein
MTMPHEELKQRQSVMWGNGPYQRVTETIGDIHERVIHTLDPPFQPAPPPSSPFDWGREERVRELLGDAFELEIEEYVSPLQISSGEEYWQLFSTSYGPTKTLADSLGDRREDFHDAWVDFFETNYRSNGEIVHTREYLLVLGTRR